jgi:hypothetical protein
MAVTCGSLFCKMLQQIVTKLSSPTSFKLIITGRIAEYFVFQVAIQKRKDLGTITMPVVLHGCETWSLTLRENVR